MPLTVLNVKTLNATYIGSNNKFDMDSLTEHSTMLLRKYELQKEAEMHSKKKKVLISSGTI